MEDMLEDFILLFMDIYGVLVHPGVGLRRHQRYTVLCISNSRKDQVQVMTCTCHWCSSYHTSVYICDKHLRSFPHILGTDHCGCGLPPHLVASCCFLRLQDAYCSTHQRGEMHTLGIDLIKFVATWRPSQEKQPMDAV